MLVVQRADNLARGVKVKHSRIRHLNNFVFNLLNCYGRSAQHMLLHKAEARPLGHGVFILFVGNHFCNQLNKQIGKRKHYNYRYNIEYRMEHRKLQLRRMREHFAEDKAVIYSAYAHKQPDYNKHDYAADVEY